MKVKTILLLFFCLLITPRLILAHGGGHKEEKQTTSLAEKNTSLNDSIYSVDVGKNTELPSIESSPLMDSPFSNNSLSDNSLKNIDPNEIVIVLFHVPWCGHCKKFVPQWPKITEGLPDDINGVNVKTVKIDCEERKDLAKKYGIRAFPTIKFLYQNQVIKHIGDRTLSGIKSKLESVANI